MQERKVGALKRGSGKGVTSKKQARDRTIGSTTRWRQGPKEEVRDQEIIEQKIVEQKFVGQKIVGQKIVGQKIVSDPCPLSVPGL